MSRRIRVVAKLSGGSLTTSAAQCQLLSAAADVRGNGLSSDCAAWQSLETLLNAPEAQIPWHRISGVMRRLLGSSDAPSLSSLSPVGAAITLAFEHFHN